MNSDIRDNRGIDISVIIAVRNDPKNLDKCLRAVMQSSYDAFECIVINDGSDDGLTDGIIAKYPVQTRKNSHCRGPAFSRNRGAELASGAILFFIDADVLIPPATIGNVVHEFKNDALDALIGSYDDAPGDASFLSQYKNLFHHYVHQNLGANTCTFWCGCGAVRKKVFENLNGFDAAYRRPAIEDIEFGMRLSEQGGRIVLAKHVQVKHLKRWTFWNLLKTDIFDRGVPWTELLLAKGSLPDNLNVSRSQRLFVLLSAVVLLLLLALPFAPAHFGVLAVSAALALAILISANHRFYRFFLNKRGPGFAVRVLPLHFTYFLCCGVSFGLGVLSFGKNRLLKEQSTDTAESRNIVARQQTEEQTVCPKI